MVVEAMVIGLMVMPIRTNVKNRVIVIVVTVVVVEVPTVVDVSLFVFQSFYDSLHILYI